MTRTELEARRLAAAADIAMGTKTRVLLQRYGVSRMTIIRWRQAVRDGRSLARRRAPGRPRRLTGDQDAILKRLWLLGPMVCIDAETDRWTQERFRWAIFRYVGESFSADHVGRIMHRLGLPVGRRGSVAGEKRGQAGGERVASLARE